MCVMISSKSIMGDKNVDMESYKYNYLMFTTERVSYVIQPWFVFFFGLPPTSFQTWFKVWFIAYTRVCFYIYAWIPSGESDVPILLCPIDKVGYIDRLGHFSYGIISVFIVDVQVSLHVELFLWECIGGIPQKNYIFPIYLRFISTYISCFSFVWMNVRFTR